MRSKICSEAMLKLLYFTLQDTVLWMPVVAICALARILELMMASR